MELKLKKLAPWNWFKKEEEVDHSVPVKHGSSTMYPQRGHDSMLQLHRDIDHLFDRFFREFNSPLLTGWPTFPSFEGQGVLKPRVDLSAREQEYLLTVEIPGVNEKDVRLDISGNMMTIQGEKKQEKEEKETDYYRIERSYGSFQRVLSLPEDVEQEKIKARFKDGVLSVTMPRKTMHKGEVKQIKINAENEIENTSCL
jgi:HSP20 family protein